MSGYNENRSTRKKSSKLKGFMVYVSQIVNRFALLMSMLLKASSYVSASKVLVCGLFLSTLVKPLWGQNYTANIETFGVDHGLSHHDATDVAVDSRGLVWVGTRNGLNRFDGKKFKSYYTDNGLKANHIDLLFADGPLIICIHKGRTVQRVENVSAFNSLTESVIPFSEWFGTDQIEPTDFMGIDHMNGYTFFRAKKDGKTLWFTKENGDLAQRVEHPTPFSIIGKDMNNLWLYEWENKRIVRKGEDGAILESYSTRFLSNYEEKFQIDLRFNEHKKWVYSYDSLYILKDKKVVSVKLDSDKARTTDKLVELPSKFVWKHPYTGLLWFTINSTSYLIDSNCTVYFSHTNKAQYVNNRDKFIENVVLQPTSSGLNIISLYPSNFENFTKDFKGGYRGIAKLNDEYIVCNETGIFVLDKDFNQKKERLALVGSNAFTFNKVTYTMGRSLVHEIDERNEVSDVFYVRDAHDVWGMYIEDSFVYYSTTGLHQLDLRSRKTKPIKSNEFPEINNATIYAIQHRSGHEYWLVTTSGLFSWNMETQRFAKVLDNVEGNSEFRHLYDGGNTLWVATGGKGLVRYDRSTKSSEYFDFGDNQTNITHAVYPDGEENLWLSTDNGLVRFNTESEEFRVFKQNEGLVNNEFNRISHFQDEDGTLIFGGIKGLVRFHPDSLTNTSLKRSDITPFVVDAWLYKQGGSRVSQLTQAFNEKKSITIEPQDRFLSFDLATNSIEYYDKVSFSYKMNDDEEWNSLPSNRLEFNVLPFGQHTITVRSQLSDGYSSEQDLSFRIDVQKPFYLQFGFVVGVVLGLLLVSALIIWLRTKRLNQQKQVLESEVSKRTQKIKEDKETIEQQADELKSLDKMKNRFFANISHELRNPLTLIVGPVENLLNQGDVRVPGMVRSQMGLTLKNARSLQKRVNEILALSKIDSGKLKLNVSPIKPESFVRRLVAAHDSFASSEDLKLQFRSKVAEGLVLEIDIDHAEKIINNLLSNAIKHSPKDSSIAVELFETAGDAYCISIADQGKGVATAEQEKIFDRYYQSKEGEKAGGTGLGLSLSNELAQLMGGSIRVDAAYTMGAKFLFTFKAATSNKEAIEFDSKTAIEPDWSTETTYVELQPSGIEANVLVVDDNEEMRLYIKSILGSKCRIFEAENGLKALEILETRSIDLITSDLMMPEMDGMELLEVLKSKEATKAIPIIMLTARAEDADKLHALEIGVDDYITKPFYARELLARVQNLLEKRSMRAQALSEEAESTGEMTDAEVQMQRVLEVIDEHLHNNGFSVLDLAEQVGYSERQLRRIIKKEKGVTPNNLIKELRLNRARLYLEQQKFATASEVMYACGMKSPGHFTKSYFERFGKKPGEYFD